MSAIPELDALVRITAEPAAQAIGWALLQFVWQGALIGALAAVTLAALRRSDADVRYVVASIALCLMLTVPVVTAVQGITAARTSRESKSLPPHPAASAAPVEAASVRLSVPRAASEVPSSPAAVANAWEFRLVAPWVLAVWTLGVLVLTLRLVSGWLWVRHLRTHSASPARESLREVTARLARRLHVSRTVRLLESAIVDVPTVVGWLKPVILIPTSALAGLTPTQLEAILAHELAHIRRHDYVVNLLQTLVETLLFYHPAVWWVSKQIRIERENCCDDLAVKLCGDPILYAQALADLEHLRSADTSLVLAANGGSLLHRVKRLLGAPSHAGRGPGWLAGAVAVSLIVTMGGIAAAAIGREVAVRSPRSSSRGVAADAAHPHRVSEHLKESAHLFREGLHQLREGANHIREGLNQIRMAAHRQVPQLPPPPPLPPELPEAPEPPEPPDPPEMAAMHETPAPPELPELPEPPEPPQSVEPPAPPEPPEPAFVDTQESHSSSRQSSGNFAWSHNGEKLEVGYRGDVEFTDDDKDIKSLSPGGWLRIKNRGSLGEHAVEFRADASGNIERRFWSGSSERPFEPEGRKWLEQVLPRLIRQTGIGARARVANIYRVKGAQGVLSEVSLIDGSWAKRIYLTELLKTPGLDERAVEQVFLQAGREIDSDFELASLLISADHLLRGDATRKAYFGAARTIDSDFEMRRVFSAALKQGPIAPTTLAGVLEASTAIESDFELASLLVDFAREQPLDGSVRGPYFKAVDAVDNNFERRRVLASLMKRSDVSDETVLEVIKATSAMSASFESAQVLLAVSARRPLTREARDAYLDAAEKLGEVDQGRVLTALVRNDRRQ